MRTALVLHREPLTELTVEDLAGVVGGSTVLTPAVVTAIVRETLTPVPTADGTCW